VLIRLEEFIDFPRKLRSSASFLRDNKKKYLRDNLTSIITERREKNSSKIRLSHYSSTGLGPTQKEKVYPFDDFLDCITRVSPSSTETLNCFGQFVIRQGLRLLSQMTAPLEEALATVTGSIRNLDLVRSSY